MINLYSPGYRGKTCCLPFQIITGSVLAKSFAVIADLRGFGTSLASGVDVDGNTQMGR